MPKLSVLMPCYFNEANLPITTAALIENEALYPPGTEFEYVLVDDGSKDGTWAEIQKFKAAHPARVRAIRLAKNVGSWNAILAAMTYATGDVNVILAADLQDPPELIPQLLGHWARGYKLVIANRTDREESWSQKLFSNTFHNLIRRYGIRSVPKGGFDMVLFDREIREQVIAMDEKNAHVLYLIAWLGHDYVAVPYVRRRREVGKSRWTLSKKVKTFIDSFVAFSFFPIRAISTVGVVLGVLAILYALFLLLARIFGWIDVQGWTALMVVLLLVSAFQMIALGILGEYIWRTLDAARNRPNFVVAEKQL